MNIYKRLLIDFLQLDKRIQLVSAIAVFAAIVGLSYLSIIKPVFNDIAKAEKNISSTQSALNKDKTNLEKLKKFNIDDEIASHKKQIAELTQQINELSLNLNDTEQFYLSSQQLKDVMMPNIISHNLKLKNFILMPQQTFDTKGVKVPYLLYKHPARIEFEGSFRDIYQYLTTIQMIEKRIYLTQVNLTVKQYPILKMSMDVYSFSDGKISQGAQQ